MSMADARHSRTLVLRIVVPGCGRIGQIHAANLKRHLRTELVAVHNVNRQAAERLAATEGVRATAMPGWNILSGNCGYLHREVMTL